MIMHLKEVKAVLLAGLILIGMGVHCNKASAASTEVLTGAGGCFWCVEADFESVSGVKEVVSGYTGGTTKNPTYKEVTRGGTGHYEAVQIFYDPARVSEEQLLDLFFRSIDPTDAGGQFCDRGASYRTAIFASDAGTRQAAEAAKAKAAQELGRNIVTPILNAGPFYKAEDYHQDYYKGSKLVITRGGPKKQSSAYKFYREGCNRDQRVRQLWGSAAPFVGS
ncbi:peptide-methionine (S)-S-oxide reductase [Roseovarius sp. HI0049]|nr:peptide-methionine (S)-S-oxide reductase [Roseovarius sp. HI0049]